MKKLIGKIQCKLGWHNWTCKIKDYLDEFGCVPLDNRVPMNATLLSGMLHPSLKVISYTPSYNSHPGTPSKLIESIGV